VAVMFSKMKDRLKVLKRGKTKDSEGFPIPEEEQVNELFYECYTQVFTLQGREYFSAAAVQAENNVRFLIRYTKKELTSDMLIEFKGKLYEIVAPPINDSEANKTITIIARRLTSG
jgi:SPP1 family predicted phage head-tail adaptor